MYKKPLPFKYWLILQRMKDLGIAVVVLSGPVTLGYYGSSLIRGAVEAMVTLGQSMGY
jgi:hypothetical protein